MGSLGTAVRNLDPTPLLSAKHNGIPERLTGDAKKAKERVWTNKTVPDSVPRQSEGPRLPYGVSREAFDSAIEELKNSLGETNVEVNDKPLVDGWYMEHP